MFIMDILNEPNAEFVVKLVKKNNEFVVESNNSANLLLKYVVDYFNKTNDWNIFIDLIKKCSNGTVTDNDILNYKNVCDKILYLSLMNIYEFCNTNLVINLRLFLQFNVLISFLYQMSKYKMNNFSLFKLLKVLITSSFQGASNFIIILILYPTALFIKQRITN